MPGVSTNTICPSARFFTATMRLRVVWGLSDTIATFVPIIRLSRVDFPAFGRPTSEANPARAMLPLELVSHFGLDPLEPHAIDAAALRFQHFAGHPVELEPLARGRHPADTRQYIATDCFKAVRLYIHVQALAHVVEVHLAAEHEGPVWLLGDRFRFDVVFVADFADDLLEQVLDGREASRPAILVHHDRDLCLTPLELLEQVRHSLGL